MRRLRQLSMAAVLTLMLGTYALAGTVDTPPGTVDTPPASKAPSATGTGITDTPPSDGTPTAPPVNAVVDVALYLLQTVLSAF